MVRLSRSNRGAELVVNRSSATPLRLSARRASADPSERAHGFPALLPFQVLHYPIPQLMREQPPTPWARWPGHIEPKVQRWGYETRELATAGNQLYVHVPFCPFYCHFCPLYKTKEARHRNEQTRERFVSAVVAEIHSYAQLPQLSQKRFRTLYFGGGTPTQLTPEQIGRIVKAIKTSFAVDDDAEITLEGVATQMLAPGYLEACLAAGINRISFGVQSLDPMVRQKIGRGEKPEDYEQLIDLVRSLDTDLPFNVDLMIGLPGQDLDSHDRDLTTILQWDVGSADIYSYWMVPGTRLFDNVVAGRRQAPRYGEALLEMRRHGNSRLVGSGFHQISGEAYVRTDPDVFMQTTFGGGGNTLNTALGFGPSAIGFVAGTLYQNVADLDAYLAAIEAGLVPARASQRIDLTTARRRAVLMGLQRLKVPRAVLGAHELDAFHRWAAQGLVEPHDDAFHLTAEGALWYNQMQMDLIPMSEQYALIGLLGTARDQATLLAKAPTDETDPTEQLLAMIGGNGGMWGAMRVWGYKSLVRLKRLGVFNDRAIGFGGPLPSHTYRVEPRIGEVGSH
jgi:coproporphyrinogen III oxidase-like Fe-S oxidoreductase